MFRSEEMAFCEMLLPYESAYEIIAELGELGQTQFLDFNEDATLMNRKYGATFKQCCDLERTLGDLEVSISKENIKLSKVTDNPSVPDIVGLDNLKTTLSELTTKLNESAKNIEKMKEQQRTLICMINVIDLTQPYTLSELLATDDTFAGNQDTLRSVTGVTLRVPTATAEVPRSPTLPARSIIRGHSALTRAQAARVSALLECSMGVLDRRMVKSFEKMLFRVGRGNVFVRTMPIDDTAFGMLDKINERKSVFIAYFNSQALKEKVTHICNAFHANIYDFPEKADRNESRQNMLMRLEDVKSVLNQAIDQRQMLLAAAAQQVQTWQVQVGKAKAVCSVMGMLNWDVTRNYIVAECWCAIVKLPDVQAAVQRANARASKRPKHHTSDRGDAPAIIEQKPIPPGNKMPTYFRANKLTKAYQNIVNAYAVPLPGEINPSLFTVITFPFLFSVMFGDFGHAVVLTVFGLWMIIKEKSLKKLAENSESFRMIFGGRYLVLLMGLFSMHAGVIYNDAFCKSFRIFDPKWHSNFTVEDLRRHNLIGFDPVLGRNRIDHWPYPFGIDPIWDIATNRLMFQNSVKMKLSVIFGVFHMLFGICLSLINHVHFKSYIDIFCNFIPQLLFICCLFVYMDAMIIFKWLYFDATITDQAPSVLIGMINMVLFKYNKDTPSDKFISDNLMKLQYALVVVALITIPWMLFVKPLYLRRQNKIKQELKKTKKLSKSSTSLQEIVVSEEQRETSDGTQVIHRGTKGSVKQSEKQGGGRTEHEIYELQHVSAAYVSELRRSEPTSVFPSTSIQQEIAPSGEDKRSNGPKDETVKEEEFQFSEVFIHQAIHTIEYVLGLISHTASYLRLWALNLAHSELSTVLWHMVFRLAFSNAHDGFTGIIALVIIFIPWSVLTVAILVIMEGVSAFLHALRLHWVEFQSKFYIGGGELFRPLTFRHTFSGKN